MKQILCTALLILISSSSFADTRFPSATLTAALKALSDAPVATTTMPTPTSTSAPSPPPPNPIAELLAELDRLNGNLENLTAVIQAEGEMVNSRWSDTNKDIERGITLAQNTVAWRQVVAYALLIGVPTAFINLVAWPIFFRCMMSKAGPGLLLNGGNV